MSVAANNMFEEIIRCNRCEGHKPFHFEMGQQQIMLISFTPSYFAQHRPLYFVQLFRKMCLALFGDANPSERFIKEFYDPAGNIYWTHYQKCFREGTERGAAHCEPLLEKEIEVLDPEVIIVLGDETAARLCGEWQHCISVKKDGTPRQVFYADYPKDENAKDFENIRKGIKPYIDWVNVECDNLDFSSANFIDLEYASIEYLNISTKEKNVTVEINTFEQEWVNKIIMPNIRAYNLVLQIFIFIESNIKNLLESKLTTQQNIDKIWFTPFEELIYNTQKNLSEPKKQAVRNLMRDIDCLRTLRNTISHKSGVIDEQDRKRSLNTVSKLKRLKGIYIYGGNSVFVSQEGITHILAICNRFKETYTDYFLV
jgi:uracil-DNA glycosylase